LAIIAHAIRARLLANAMARTLRNDNVNAAVYNQLSLSGRTDSMHYYGAGIFCAPRKSGRIPLEK
jgi:hypothetical protein